MHEGLYPGSDLYALGGVLYVVATGARSPGEVRLLRAQRPDLPSAFGDLMAELLAESPDNRPSDAETVLERLNDIRYASNVGALIAAAESDNIELKSSLHHPHGPLPRTCSSSWTWGNCSLDKCEKDAEAAQQGSHEDDCSIPQHQRRHALDRSG